MEKFRKIFFILNTLLFIGNIITYFILKDMSNITFLLINIVIFLNNLAMWKYKNKK